MSGRPFQVYVHVPYCRRRCGYCDFNTYVGTGEGYAGLAVAEMELARRWLGQRGVEGRQGGECESGREGASKWAAATVFFGGGTPTVLPAGDLVTMLGAVRA
ncbi:MAG: hypothetical protein LBR19_07075, partial [Bifidobacteriaceae bacterium]|nr:hypothetical protein [Bifidobacteriaceae bacterium]